MQFRNLSILMGLAVALMLPFASQAEKAAKPAAAPAPSAATPAAAQPAAAPQPAAAAATPPSPEQLVALIRSTVMAVNQANLTGNYSVLRDLGAPGFQQAQTQESLSKNFEGFRKGRIDTGITAAVIPQLTKPPFFDGAAGTMRLTGYYPTNPQVNFDFAFQLIGGRWQHLGIAMGTSPSAVASAPAAKAPLETGSIKTAAAKPADKPEDKAAVLAAKKK